MSDSRFLAELAYWERELSLQGDYPEAILNRVKPERMDREFPFYLMPLIDKLRNVNHRPPKVLDVGSGPLSMLAYGHHNHIIDLTCVDPLADEYARLLTHYGYTIEYPIIAGYAEHLSKIFGRDSFDLVWIHNSLDHTQDPATAMKEMVAVLRPSGYLVVQGWEREGTAQGFNGLHQHDLYITENGRLMVQSYIGDLLSKPRCISSGLPIRVVEFSISGTSDRPWFKVVWKKVKSVYQPLYHLYRWLVHHF